MNALTFVAALAIPCAAAAQSLEFGSVTLRLGMPADSAIALAGKDFELFQLPDLGMWIAQPRGQPEAPTYGSIVISGRRLTKVTREWSGFGDSPLRLAQAMFDAVRFLPARVDAGWSTSTPCDIARREDVIEGGKTVQTLTVQCGRYDTTLRIENISGAQKRVSVTTSITR